jgi:hypothetical protein
MLELLNADSGLAPEGKGDIKGNFPCDYDRWKEPGGMRNGRLRKIRESIEAMVLMPEDGMRACPGL